MKRLLLLTFVSLFSLNALTLHAAPAPADFAMSNTYLDVKISPDGKHFAVKMRNQGKVKVVMLDSATYEAKGVIAFPGYKEPGRFYWVNNSRLITQIFERDAWDAQAKFYGELFAVDLDGGNGALVYSRAANGGQNGWAYIEDMLSYDDKHILIRVTPKSKDQSLKETLHVLNVYNGQMGYRIVRAPVAKASFILDENYEARFAYGVNQQNRLEAYVRNLEDKKWEQVDNSVIGSDFHPLAMNDKGDSIYLLANADKDRVGLYKMHLQSRKLTHIYTDDHVDIADVVYTADGSAIYAMRVDNGYPAYLMVGSKNTESKVFKNLIATFPGQQVDIASYSSDGKLWVVEVGSDVSASTYYLYDKVANQLSLLFKNQEHISSKTLASMTPIQFKTSDDKTVSGYLTYPQGSEQSKVPLVTLVHGGPHARDVWAYDAEVQLLASQGYAVLQVNYRGSTGYGSEFEVLGYRHWGDHIQRDVIEGTQWAIAQGRIDSSKVCVMGASFGAYSAVQSSLLAPDLFKCAVANAGFYDIPSWVEEVDFVDIFDGNAYVERSVGLDPKTQIAFSPAQHIENLKAEVFIAHGKQDQRTPYSQAETLKAAMDKHNKPYEWFVKSEEGHGFIKEENRAEYYQKVAGFLAKHLQ